jgi:hypothetical protein
MSWTLQARAALDEIDMVIAVDDCLVVTKVNSEGWGRSAGHAPWSVDGGLHVTRLPSRLAAAGLCTTLLPSHKPSSDPDPDPDPDPRCTPSPHGISFGHPHPRTLSLFKWILPRGSSPPQHLFPSSLSKLRFVLGNDRKRLQRHPPRTLPPTER